MSKNKRYLVNVCRIAYSHREIEVSATSQKKAMRQAEVQADNYLFPNEHTSEYEAQGATLVKDPIELRRTLSDLNDFKMAMLMKKSGSVAEAKEDGFTRSFR